MNLQLEYDLFKKPENIWGLILSGGEGTRLRPLITKLYGTNLPKQYCSIVGKRSMLQHTLDRIKSFIPCQQILTVVNPCHLEIVQEQLNDQPPENIIVQPYNRGTAVGILLPMLHIYQRDPDAIVAIFPSDHFIFGEKEFMRYVAHAFNFVRNYQDSIMLLGISPSKAELEYGWIEKGKEINNPWNIKIHQVKRFWEKPDQSRAEILFFNGCLWNTFVLVGHARTFLSQFKKMVPDIFDQLYQTIRLYNPLERKTILKEIYPLFPLINFSKAILESCTDNLCVIEVSDTNWSDWGNEHRILSDIGRHNLKLHDYEIPPISHF
jgi:mannose-1-phosphate guanylyltransferase